MNLAVASNNGQSAGLDCDQCQCKLLGKLLEKGYDVLAPLLLAHNLLIRGLRLWQKCVDISMSNLLIYSMDGLSYPRSTPSTF
jgi:hypothetical protein